MKLNKKIQKILKKSIIIFFIFLFNLLEDYINYFIILLLCLFLIYKFKDNDLMIWYVIDKLDITGIGKIVNLIKG
jgi:hypothetical protein